MKERSEHAQMVIDHLREGWPMEAWARGNGPIHTVGINRPGTRAWKTVWVTTFRKLEREGVIRQTGQRDEDGGRVVYTYALTEGGGDG